MHPGPFYRPAGDDLSRTIRLLQPDSATTSHPFSSPSAPGTLSASPSRTALRAWCVAHTQRPSFPPHLPRRLSVYPPHLDWGSRAPLKALCQKPQRNMDSMRNLNNSLPRSGPRRRNAQSKSHAELLQAFRTAALSVTQLYKNAAADNQNAREAGYQEALEDVLTFLDQENIGLGDGEGWRVRRWATERLSPESFAVEGEANESDGDEVKDTQSRASSAQPLAEPSKATPSAPNLRSVSEEAPKSFASAPSMPPAAEENTPVSEPPQSSFLFRAAGPQLSFSDMDVDGAGAPLARSNRNHRPATNARSAAAAKEHINALPLTFLSTGAGSKRKQAFTDLFDISDISTKGPAGGAKRGRRS